MKGCLSVAKLSMLQSAKLSYSQGDMTSLRSDHFHRIFNNGTDPDVGWVCVVCVWFVCWYLVCALTQFIFDVGLLSVVSQMTGGMDGTALIVACVRSSGGVALSLACCFGCLHNLDNEDILQALKEWEEEMVTKMVARMNIERQEQQEQQEQQEHKAHHIRGGGGGGGGGQQEQKEQAGENKENSSSEEKEEDILVKQASSFWFRKLARSCQRLYKYNLISYTGFKPNNQITSPFNEESYWMVQSNYESMVQYTMKKRKREGT